MLLINNLPMHIKAYRQEIDQAIRESLDSGWLVLGPLVTQFEKNFAEYVGVAHCVTLANGTDALELALKAAGVEPGDGVATVANAGFYTSTALLACGAQPIYMDVQLDTKVAALSDAQAALSTPGVKALVLTHLYGQAAPDTLAIADACRKAGVAFIEDCAQAHGAQLLGKQVGSFGDMACFSFYPTKNLGALGDGGAVVTNDLSLQDRLLKLRQYGWSSKYQVGTANARNSRLDELQAAVLLKFLPHLNQWNARRREISTLYFKGIAHPLIQTPALPGLDNVAHLYVLCCDRRAELQAHLKSLDIGSDIHYPTPDYRQAVFGERYAELKLANTEALAPKILTIPCFPEMSDADVHRVIEAINTWKP